MPGQCGTSNFGLYLLWDAGSNPQSEKIVDAFEWNDHLGETDHASAVQLAHTSADQACAQKACQDKRE